MRDSSYSTELDYNQWDSDPRIKETIAANINDYIFAETHFESGFGRGATRLVRTLDASISGPIVTPIDLPIVGDGVVGNADFSTNYGTIEFVGQTIYPSVMGHGIKSDIKFYEKARVGDWMHEAEQQLKEWMKRKNEKQILCALANNPTNAIFPDASGGYKTIAAGTTIKAAANAMLKTDVLNVKTLRRAILMARLGIKYDQADLSTQKTPPFLAPRLTKKTAEGIEMNLAQFVFCLSTFACEQLKRDPEWQEMQKYAGPRTKENALFTGYVGVIDNCPVIDIGSWSSVNPGAMHSAVGDDEYLANIVESNYVGDEITKPSEFAGSDCDLDFGFLLGANALFAATGKTNVYIDSIEGGRKTMIGVDKVASYAKAKIRKVNLDKLKYFANNDLAVITIFSPHNI